VKRLIQILFMLLIGGGAFYYVFKDVKWSEFSAELSKVHYPTFVAGLALFVGLHLSRSIRWGRLVQTVEPSIKFRSYFSICSIGFFLINVLPFRIGEFVRPYLLLDREEVPFGSGMATVLVERVLDVAALGVIFVGVLLWGVDGLESTPVVIGDTSYDLVQVGRTAILAALIPFGGGILVLLALGDRGIALSRRIFGLAGARFGDRVAGFLETFLHAVRQLGSWKEASRQLSWTAAAWGVNVCSMWVMAKAFPFGAEMGFWDGATILVTVCIVLIIPPPPGFAGVFELGIAVSVTHLYGNSEAVAAAFGALVHVSQFVILVVLGAGFLAVDRISLTRLLEEMNSLRKADTSPA